MDENKVEESAENLIREVDIEDRKAEESKSENKVKESKIEETPEKESVVIKEETKEKSEDKLLKERKEKFLKLFKSREIWVVGVLIIALILGVYIRSMPMHDHNKGAPGVQPGLWDFTRNTWTLGPDLDPWLFTRQAKEIVEQGSIPKMDFMRYPPLGYSTSRGTVLLPYMIAWTYYIISTFKSINVEFAAVIFPVIMFAFTIIAFFLFVREIFIGSSRESRNRANIISIISTFFLIVIPSFLARTIAGIPEKESAAFFFMFLAFYFFLKSWKQDKTKKALIYSAISGFSTALMGLIWGGVVYAFATIGLFVFLAFIFGEMEKKEIKIYFVWLFVTILIMDLLSEKYSTLGLIRSTDHLVPFVVFFIILIHLLIWKTPISKKFGKIRIPKTLISLIAAIVVGVIVVLITIGPELITRIINNLVQIFIKPTTGRWGITVAENRQPYFSEWGNSFGPFIKNFPVLFWLFFIGSIIAFKDMLKKINKKESLVLTSLYLLFFLGLVFSRYSGSSVFNGENFISKSFYFGTTLLLIVFVLYYFIKDYKKGRNQFKELDFNLLFLFSLFILCLVTVRSAVRLIMVLATIAPIFVSYLIVVSIEKFRKSKDDTLKIALGAFVILVILLSAFSFVTYYNTTKAQAYNFIPSIYNQQWQKAMKWVRDETPKDAVFSHWWDYGYWVQSIGERTTVLDGGNIIRYWNYLMGRLVLTGDNPEEALEFLYNHNATHLLIDSTDIGKYGAFSSIGSDKEYDRYSWIGTFLLDDKQTMETNNKTVYVYSGGTALDGDLKIEQDGKEIWLPKQKAGVGAIVLELGKKGNKTSFGQPSAIMFYNGVQYKIDLRYLSVGEEFIDFGSGIEGGAYIFPRLISQGQSVNSNPIGASMFLSPRLMRGLLTQLYILNDPFDKFKNFELVHTESDLAIDSLRNQGLSLPDFVYFQGLRGPIKIWKINYTGNEKINQEYIDIDESKYLDWKL